MLSFHTLAFYPYLLPPYITKKIKENEEDENSKQFAQKKRAGNIVVEGMARRYG